MCFAHASIKGLIKESHWSYIFIRPWTRCFAFLDWINEINNSTENFGGRVQFNQFFSWDETIAVVTHIIFWECPIKTFSLEYFSTVSYKVHINIFLFGVESLTRITHFSHLAKTLCTHYRPTTLSCFQLILSQRSLCHFYDKQCLEKDK